MSEKIHAVRIFVNAPFDSVWAWVSDPSRFPTIYPSWVRRVTKGRHTDGEAYEGVMRDGGRIEIMPSLDERRGQVHFEIVNQGGNLEVFHTLLVRSTEEGENTSTGIFYWWEGVDDAFQEGLRLGIIKADLHRVRETIEHDAAQDAQGWYSYGLAFDEGEEALACLHDSRVGREDGEVHIPTFARNVLERLREF